MGVPRDLSRTKPPANADTPRRLAPTPCVAASEVFSQKIGESDKETMEHTGTTFREYLHAENYTRLGIESLWSCYAHDIKGCSRCCYDPDEVKSKADVPPAG